MDNASKKAWKRAHRKKMNEDNAFDGRFFERAEEKPDRYLDEREHIEESRDDGEEEFSIEVSEHRL